MVMTCVLEVDRRVSRIHEGFTSPAATRGCRAFFCWTFGRRWRAFPGPRQLVAASFGLANAVERTPSPSVTEESVRTNTMTFVCHFTDVRNGEKVESVVNQEKGRRSLVAAAARVEHENACSSFRFTPRLS